MALSYPENTVWYIEARPWSGTKETPGFAPAKAASMGSGVVVTFTSLQPNGERKTRSYILTCAHVVRDRSDCLLEDILCYPPGKGFIGTIEHSRRSGTFEHATVRTASVSRYSPCKGERGPRPEHLRNDPATDWVLLEIHDPSFRNLPSVKSLCEDYLADQTLQVIGFPGGDIAWKNGEIVRSATARGFRLRGDSEPGMVDYDGPEETRPGMSGCGIFDEADAFVGIHRSCTDCAMKREGICATAIARQLRENYQIEFVSEASAQLDNDDRIQQLQLRLLSRFKEIKSVFTMITEQIQRMVEEGIQETDETILNHVEQFLDRSIDSDTFIGFCQSLDDDKDNDKPDYQALARQLKNGRVIFCLGQELSHIFDAQLPSTEEIKKHLGVQDIHVPLSELCEQKELLGQASKRTGLLTTLCPLFMNKENIHAIALYELLAKLDKPSLIISIGYDDLLEQTLQGKFAVIHPDITSKTCLLKFSDQKKEVCCTSETIAEYDLLANDYTVIYRLRGDILNNDGHLLLSEKDYFAFAQCIEEQFPEYIGSRLRNPQNSLWIMGHHPASWEERLLIRLLQTLRKDRRSLTIAVQKDASPFARAFWKDNDVTLYDLPLAEFVQGLEEAL